MLLHPLLPPPPQVLKREHEAGNGDFCARVVTCALTYLHREKFRSDLGVAFACPVTLKASEYPALVGGEGGEAAAVDQIMKVCCFVEVRGGGCRL